MRIQLALLLGLTCPLFGDVTVTDRLHHLGDSDVREWKGIVKPEGKRLEARFQARAVPACLEIGQRDVSDVWTVSLNGTALGVLERTKGNFTRWLDVPEGVLRDGENVLVVAPRVVGDDVVVGPIGLVEKPLHRVLHLGRVRVSVTDPATGRPVPARVTVASPDGKPVPIYNAASPSTAVRIGTMYTLGSGDPFEVPEGDYVLYATRGMEWGMAERRVRVEAGGDHTLELSIAREVDTTGFVATDTHVHTYTFSGHGDATIQERMITLAGEGVELAIATDHNHQIDYAPVQEEMGVNPFFRPVVGNEVTTDNGHFNAFPMPARGPLPDHKLRDWVKLVEDIRSKGAKVVILNHPHWPDLDRGPFGVHGLEPGSGDRATGTAYTFDCLELVNSTTHEPEPLTLLADWMALLNRGERLTGIGSSDSHTVDDPVGQGRTYVRSSTDDPSEIDVDEMCEAFLRGDVSVSLGIFAEVEVDGQRMGKVVPVRERKVQVSLRVAAPSWIRPRTAIFFLNGMAVHKEPVPVPESGPAIARLRVELPLRGGPGRPGSQDAHLVCAVLGDGVKKPGWTTLSGHTLAVTNPVYLDADGDGMHSSPREQARAAIESMEEGDLERTLLLAGDAVAVQMLSVLREERGFDVTKVRQAPQACKRYLDWVRRAATHAHSH